MAAFFVLFPCTYMHTITHACTHARTQQVDAVTFGKATGGGIYPLSGVIIRRGRGSFDVVKSAKTDSRKLIQMHTYASASQRSLMARKINILLVYIYYGVQFI